MRTFIRRRGDIAKIGRLTPVGIMKSHRAAARLLVRQPISYRIVPTATGITALEYLVSKFGIDLIGAQRRSIVVSLHAGYHSIVISYCLAFTGPHMLLTETDYDGLACLI